MGFRNTRRVIWAILALAIVVDLSFDLFALRQSYVMDATAAEVNKANSSLNELSEMRVSVGEFLNALHARDLARQKTALITLQEHYQNARELSPSEPRLKQFHYLLNPSGANRDYLEPDLAALNLAISDLQKSAEHRIRKQMEVDDHANLLSRLQVFAASLVDLILMISAGLLFWYYDRARKVYEAAIEGTMLVAQRSNHELQSILSRRAQDLRSTVHDLKNPLGSIKGFSEILAEEKNNPDSVAQLTDTLQRISAHTLVLVNSLLEADEKALRAPGAPSLTADLRLCLGDVCAAMKPQMLKKRQTLNFEAESESCEVYASPAKLWDVCANLIGNAVKFSPLDSEIRIALLTRSGRALMTIEDEGPGFSASDKAKSFEPYHKLGARPTGGEISSGLGLNICVRYIEEMGGTFEIHDGRGRRGARIMVSLRLAEMPKDTHGPRLLEN